MCREEIKIGSWQKVVKNKDKKKKHNNNRRFRVFSREVKEKDVPVVDGETLDSGSPLKQF